MRARRRVGGIVDWICRRGSGEAFFGGGGFNLAVDLGAQQDHEASDVEPREKDDDGSKRAVGKGEEVEEVEIEAETQ